MKSTAILLIVLLSTFIKVDAQLASGIPHVFSVTAATPPAFPVATNFVAHTAQSD